MVEKETTFITNENHQSNSNRERQFQIFDSSHSGKLIRIVDDLEFKKLLFLMNQIFNA